MNNYVITDDVRDLLVSFLWTKKKYLALLYFFCFGFRAKKRYSDQIYKSGNTYYIRGFHIYKINRLDDLTAFSLFEKGNYFLYFFHFNQKNFCFEFIEKAREQPIYFPEKSYFSFSTI